MQSKGQLPITLSAPSRAERPCPKAKSWRATMLSHRLLNLIIKSSLIGLPSRIIHNIRRQPQRKHKHRSTAGCKNTVQPQTTPKDSSLRSAQPCLTHNQYLGSSACSCRSPAPSTPPRHLPRRSRCLPHHSTAANTNQALFAALTSQLNTTASMRPLLPKHRPATHNAQGQQPTQRTAMC